MEAEIKEETNKVWLTGKWAFITDPNDRSIPSKKYLLALEWLYFVEDDDNPVQRQLQITDAFET